MIKQIIIQIPVIRLQSCMLVEILEYLWLRVTTHREGDIEQNYEMCAVIWDIFTLLVKNEQLFGGRVWFRCEFDRNPLPKRKIPENCEKCEVVVGVMQTCGKWLVQQSTYILTNHRTKYSLLIFLKLKYKHSTSIHVRSTTWQSIFGPTMSM